MRKAKYNNPDNNSMCVDIIGLMKLLNSGRATAERIGKESQSAFKVGNRKLYKVDKVNAYLETLTEKQ